MSMIRKQVYIEKRQEEALKAASARLGVSEAALIRQGIDRCLDSVVVPLIDVGAWEDELAYIRNRHSVTPARERTWTRDELYDR
ncbi:MAG: hypothetical protein WC314_10270 [Vulcanimicrobiota bacterium]